MYQYSFFELTGGLIAVIIVIVASIRNRGLFSSYRLSFLFMIIGIVTVTISCVFNSMSADRWDKDFVIAFLLLKKINGLGWLVRGPAYAGYIFFIWGVIVLLITKFRDNSGT